MRDTRRRNHLYLLRSRCIRAEVVEEASSGAEENGDERDEEHVHEPGSQTLLDGRCAAADPADSERFCSLRSGPAVKPSSDIIMFPLSLLNVAPAAQRATDCADRCTRTAQSRRELRFRIGLDDPEA
jgi:hypothetical protein